MNAVEEAPTLNQAQRLTELNLPRSAGAAAATQQLLDELLGRFEDDDSPAVLRSACINEFSAASDE
jgi:hypothetical protein